MGEVWGRRKRNRRCEKWLHRRGRRYARITWWGSYPRFRLPTTNETQTDPEVERDRKREELRIEKAGAGVGKETGTRGARIRSLRKMLEECIQDDVGNAY